jgi:hypothetical protein
MLAPRTCENGALPPHTFRPARKDQRFCSTPCRKQAYAQQHPGPTRRGTLPAASRGAVSEMAVAIDLMESGYEVFRALSPARSCDLIALAPGVTLRIEVRTGSQSAVSGHVTYSRAAADPDHYAVVLGGRVLYEPELAPLTGGNPA